MKNKKPIDFLKKQKEAQQQKEQKWKKYITAGLVSICAIAIIGGVAVSATVSNASDKPQNFQDESLEPQAPDNIFERLGAIVFDEKKELSGIKEDRINILLLGMGGPGHEGPYLTDTIIIASIKPSSKEVAMVSIPRDLAIQIPNHGTRKINYANAYGEKQKENWGAAYTTKLIEKKFGINLHYYVRVDFKAFVELINKMEGINVKVDQPFVDNEYPAEGDKYTTVQFKRGLQKMNGERALKFARSRHGNNNQGSDFARARRQQKVLLAAKRKFLSYKTLADPKKIYNILTTLNNHITTNMSLSDIISLAEMAKKINFKNVSTLVLDSSPNNFLTSTTSNGRYFLKPKTGNFKEIKKAIDNIFSHKKTGEIVATDRTEEELPPLKISPSSSTANIEIQNGTWKPGLAAHTKRKLTKHRISVKKIGNTNKKPIKKSGIYKVTQAGKRETLLDLKEKLNIPLKKQLKPGIKISTSTDILVILGKDYKK